MTIKDQLTVALREVERDAKNLSLQLTDDFFKELDQEEIVGGDVEVNVSIRTAAGSAFRFV